MAEKSPRAHGQRESFMKLEEQLTCSVCLEHYTKPRTLPCMHSFCHNCLVCLPVKKESISCPTCRQSTKLPVDGVSGFPCAFLINSFLEINKLMKKEETSGISMTTSSCDNCHKEKANGYCKQCCKLLCQSCMQFHSRWAEFSSHQVIDISDSSTTASDATTSKLAPSKGQPMQLECTSHDQPLVVYCNTCDKLICQLCTATKQHRKHNFQPINTAFPKHHQQITESLQQVTRKLTTISSAREALLVQEKEILEKGTVVKNEIDGHVDMLIRTLQASRVQLMKNVDHMISDDVDQISSRVKELDIVAAQLETCKEFTEQEMSVGNQQQILVMKRQIVEEIKYTCTQVKEANLQPLKDIDITFVTNDVTFNACAELGRVFQSADAKIIGKGTKVATVGHKTSFMVLVKDSVGTSFDTSPLSCHLSPDSDPKSTVRCDVEQVASGRFEVTYRPSVDGVHQLNVSIGEISVPGSPFTVKVMPRQLDQVINNLSIPCGVAITNEGHLVVVEQGKHCITLINVTNGTKIRSFGKFGSGPLEFSYPWGVAVTPDGNIIVADQSNHRLQVVTVEGVYVTEVGCKGSESLEFDHPRYVAVHPTGKIFVADGSNQRIQVLNRDLSFINMFGSNGQQPGQFKIPWGIAFDSQGFVYVADRKTSFIQKFTCEGDFVSIISHKQEGGSTPLGLCFSNGDLHVANTDDNTVSMLTTDGQLLGYVSGSDGIGFKLPLDITVDSSGRLFISHRNMVTSY